jgi:hypothetical protein
MSRVHWSLVLTACASRAPATVTDSPDYRPVAGEPAPAAATFYADCLADAITGHRIERASDTTTTLLAFTCTGDAARAFYDALGPWSARIGSQFESRGQTFRSTMRVRRNLFGVDYCVSDGHCTVSLNVGDFLR